MNYAMVDMLGNITKRRNQEKLVSLYLLADYRMANKKSRKISDET